MLGVVCADERSRLKSFGIVIIMCLFTRSREKVEKIKKVECDQTKYEGEKQTED